MTIDDMEMRDAVFTIPKNSVEVVLDITTYENGALYKMKCQYDLQDIQGCFKCFDDTIAGDYPKYVSNDKGGYYELERKDAARHANDGRSL